MNQTLVNGTVDKVSFDFGVEFLVAGALVRVEGPASVGGYGETEVDFDPESIGGLALKILELLHDNVAVSVVNDSQLKVEAASGARNLIVDEADAEETWSVTLADGSKYVGAADGSVAHWSP